MARVLLNPCSHGQQRLALNHAMLVHVGAKRGSEPLGGVHLALVIVVAVKGPSRRRRLPAPRLVPGLHPCLRGPWLPAKTATRPPPADNSAARAVGLNADPGPSVVRPAPPPVHNDPTNLRDLQLSIAVGQTENDLPTPSDRNGKARGGLHHLVKPTARGLNSLLEGPVRGPRAKRRERGLAPRAQVVKAHTRDDSKGRAADRSTEEARDSTPEHRLSPAALVTARIVPPTTMPREHGRKRGASAGLPEGGLALLMPRLLGGRDPPALLKLFVREEANAILLAEPSCRRAVPKPP